jgi:hypothetical protein
LGSEQATELEGSLDATAHFWSPDSRSIAFFADGKLKKIPAAGGPAQTICGASIGFIGSWNRDGTILFTMLSGDPGIYRVSDTGGPPTLVPKPEKRILLWPHFLPDGRRYLFVGLKEDPPRAGTWASANSSLPKASAWELWTRASSTPRPARCSSPATARSSRSPSTRGRGVWEASHGESSRAFTSSTGRLMRHSPSRPQESSPTRPPRAPPGSRGSIARARP